MTESSPTRRFFSVLGRIFRTARTFTANVLFLLFLLVVLMLLFSGPETVTVPDGGALVLAPEGTVVEQRTQVAPLNQLLGADLMGETLLKDLTDALEAAAKDDRISVVVLELGDLLDASPAHLGTIGTALDAVKAAGKPIVALGDYYSQAQYYLASFADEVYMHPMGQILLTGYGAYQSYYHGLLEKLKVNVHVFRVGTYKEAVEPYTRGDMSAEAKEANQALLDTLWDRYTETVAANRGLGAGAIDGYVDEYDSLITQTHGDMARIALEQGLVDELLSRDEMRARLIARVGEEASDYRRIDYDDYVAATRGSATPSGSDGDVAVIVARGLILMGDQPRGTIGSDTFTQLVRQAREDDGIRALVIRIDSPGGAAFASELIRQELELTQLAGKPVVASMGGVAASGGYWIAATADEIWAAPSTITGSIGIFGIVPTFEQSLGAIGVQRDGVGTSELSGALDPFGGIRPQMATILQANVENGYQRFLNLVARGRDMLPEKVDEVGQGRVWSGARAHELGLVDELGTLSEAIGAAARLAGLESWGVRYIEKPLTAQEQLVQQLTDSLGLAPEPPSARSGVVDALIQLTRTPLLHMNDPLSLYTLCDRCSVSP